MTTYTAIPSYMLMSRADLESSLRPINWERDRLRTKITELMAQRDALPEGIRRDNITRQIDADDTELQLWTDVVTAREARIADLDQVGADRALSAAE